MKRRLSAIVAADVVGYSRLVRADEERTLLALRAVLENIFEPITNKHNGRIVKLMGDGILLEFNSAVEAVACSTDIQRRLEERNTDESDIVFRFGINLGDVVIEGDDIHGDGVNVASRLEALSDPGGICISDSVYEQVRDRLNLQFRDAGKQELKNFNRPVQVWKWSGSGHDQTRKNKQEESTTSAFEKPAIAVLPFVNMSGDPEQEYFVDGLVEDIITELSRFPVIAVISRQSSFAFKGEKVDITNVSETLGVQYVVEGSVRRAGNRIRISAQLIEAETGNHVWGERYDRELDDIFAVQDEVTRAIVATIAAQLGKSVSENAARKAPNSIKSYEYLLQANRLYYRFNPEDNIAAAELYQKAIERDPQSSRAYAGLANTFTTDYFLGWLRTQDALRNGLEYAQKALQFDGNDALARIILAWALIGDGQWEEAELELDRVLILKPGDADILAEAGNGFKAVGRTEVAIDLLEEAIRLNPLSPDSYQRWLGQAYYRAGRYEDAIDALRTVRMEGWGYGVLAASFARAGELENARDALSKFVSQREKELSASGMPTNTTADLLGNYRDNFRTEADWQHLLHGLHMAGLPE